MSDTQPEIIAAIADLRLVSNILKKKTDAFIIIIRGSYGKSLKHKGYMRGFTTMDKYGSIENFVKMLTEMLAMDPNLRQTVSLILEELKSNPDPLTTVDTVKI